MTLTPYRVRTNSPPRPPPLGRGKGGEGIRSPSWNERGGEVPLTRGLSQRERDERRRRRKGPLASLPNEKGDPSCRRLASGKGEGEKNPPGPFFLLGFPLPNRRKGEGERESLAPSDTHRRYLVGEECPPIYQ